MERTTDQTTAKTTRINGIRGKARKILLGLGVLAIAGTLMSAAPAMANDRGFERHDDRRIPELRHDRFWVPDRYEFRTHDDCGRIVTDRVLVEAGHWVDR
jgi:hypothetical protein